VKTLKKIRAARPKTGRKTFSYTVALTFDQIEFLSGFPNASETMRKLLSGIMEVWYDIEAKFPVLQLKQKIDVLEKQLTKLENERYNYDREHYNEMNETIKHHAPTKGPYARPGETYTWVEPKPLQTPEAEYHRTVLKNMDEAKAVIKAKIQELQNRVAAITASDDLKDKIQTS
jgi:hypothetical protein